ncbi:Aspartic peptidase [Gossypium australe]|uniref:Aspartic peptidase n=1 Tax=Gossypium australe TaxID=47621 RepID=A0A5B6WG07_9ROSI|nr:Aspartic peptidase [Gossypium australe]
MQSMKIDVKQVQSKCTKSKKILPKLENQMSQLMIMMGDIKRQIDIDIPGNIENNARKEGNEHLKAIVLRSGKVLSSPETLTQEETKKSVEDLQEDPQEADEKPELEEVMELTAEPEKESKKEPTITQVPFLSRLEKRQKWDEDEFLSFFNLFKAINVNLPLIELIEKVPKYDKFSKEIMSRRRKIKLKDPGSFTIPIEIGSIHFNRALCDLGAKDLKNTQITLQLADRSSVHPKRVLEDVLVKYEILKKIKRYPFYLVDLFLLHQSPPLI